MMEPPDTVLNGYIQADSDGFRRFVLPLERGTRPRARYFPLPWFCDELDDFLAGARWPALYWPTEDLHAWGVFSPRTETAPGVNAAERALNCLVRHWMACPDCIYQRHCALGARLDAVVEYTRPKEK